MSTRSRKRWCAGVKIRHTDQATAEAHRTALELYNARRGWIQPGRELGVYWCEVCQAFHVGHQAARPDVPTGNETQDGPPEQLTVLGPEAIP